MGKQRSNWWYLLPVFFSIIGGIIGYFIIKKDDPVKAKRLIYVGLVIVAVSIANTAVQTSIILGSLDESLLSLVSPAFSLTGG